MNFYTLTYDDARPTKQQVNIPTNSDYKIGIKVFSHRNEGKPNAVPSTYIPNPPKVIAEDLHLLPPQVSLVADDGTTISADSEIVNGYVTFTLKTDDSPSFKNYKVRVQNDTFNSVLFNEISGDAGRRTRQMAVKISCDNPITLYPSDKILNTSTFIPRAIDGIVGTADKRFYSYFSRVDDKGFYYVSQNSQTWEVGTTTTDWKAIKLTQEDIDAGHGSIWRQSMVTGKYHLEIYVVPYTNTFDLAINTFKSQQGDVADNISTGKTATLSGEYFDGTGFSYNIVVA